LVSFFYSSLTVDSDCAIDNDIHVLSGAIIALLQTTNNGQINKNTGLIGWRYSVMRDFGIREMLTEQIDIRDIVIFSVHEPLNHGLSFLNKARSSNALCLYQSGRREYEIIGGEAFALTEGDIMYIPQNARYRFRITDTGDQARDYIIVINFNMVDRNGEAVIFGEFPRILMQDKLSHYFTLFHRMENVVMSRQNHTLYVKSLLYTLFYEILYELYSLQDMNLPLMSSIVPIATLISLEILISILTLKSRFLRKLFQGKPAILINKGVLDEKEMKRQCYNLDEILEQIRQEGYSDVRDVEYAILENSGKISVIPSARGKALSAQDLGMKGSPGIMPYLVIADGKIAKTGLEITRTSEKELMKKLKEKGVNKAEEVFFAVIDSQGELYFQRREKKA